MRWTDSVVGNEFATSRRNRFTGSNTPLKKLPVKMTGYFFAKIAVEFFKRLLTTDKLSTADKFRISVCVPNKFRARAKSTSDERPTIFRGE